MTLGVKRELERPSLSEVPKKKMRCAQNRLSQQTVVERIRSSIQQFTELYGLIQEKRYVSKPVIDLAFHPKTGEMVAFFPEAIDRLRYKVSFGERSQIRATLIHGPDDAIPQNVSRMVETILKVISSHTELMVAESKVRINCLTGALKTKPLGSVFDMYVDYTLVKDPIKKPYTVGERVILYCKDSIVRIAEVKEFLEEEAMIVFSLGENKEDEAFPINVLSVKENPVLYRERKPNNKTLDCFTWLVSSNTAQLEALSNEDLLDCWHKLI